MDIPEGLTPSDEWHAVRRIQRTDVKQELVKWALSLAEWRTKADLTFASVAHPERAEKAVHRWLQKVAPGSFAIVGYERQRRWAMHAHLVVSRQLDRQAASGLWNAMAGFCRIESVNSAAHATEYVLEHAVKEMDFEVITPMVGASWLQAPPGECLPPL